MTPGSKTFASDNYAGVHPEIMEALLRANHRHAGSYGSDEYTARAVHKFREYFGANAEVFFVYNGTGANVLSIAAMTRRYNSVFCSDLAHINVDESTATENFTGCKLITMPSHAGKITARQVEERIIRVGDQHHPQPKVISISQTTEYATVYTVAEIRALADVARRHDMYLHMDGSRLSNAAVALGLDFRAFTLDAGVDLLSFGGTKNGMMFGEAVVFLNPALSENFAYVRKQGMQLHSKMRFLAAQFEALLSNNLWHRNATHANAMAQLLAQGLQNIPGVKISQPVEANGVFAIMPESAIPAIQETAFFYVWNKKLSEVRLMCSWDTSAEDVARFVETCTRVVG